MDFTLKELNCTCHNPYFNRWFSAMHHTKKIIGFGECHNPYFNRWFSAIWALKYLKNG